MQFSTTGAIQGLCAEQKMMARATRSATTSISSPELGSAFVSVSDTRFQRDPDRYYHLSDSLMRAPGDVVWYTVKM